MLKCWKKHFWENWPKNSLLGNLKSRSRPPEFFLGKVVLKICSKFAREHPCRILILIKLICNFNWNFCNFIEILVRNEYSHVNLLHIFRTPFYKNTYGELFLTDATFKNFKPSSLTINIAGMYLGGYNIK